MSVDVKNGDVLGKYIEADFEDMIKIIQHIKPLEVILLDISGVGTGNGFDHEIINSFKGLETELILGGGVTHQNINHLSKMGVHKFLVGTSLHMGTFNYKL